MTVIDTDMGEIFSRVSKRWRLSGARFIVTGSGGFLGYYYSNFLIRYFEELGLEELVLVDLKQPKVANHSIRDNNKIRFLQGDLSDSSRLEIDPTDFDVFINLASFASPVAYRANPIGTMRGSVLTVWGLIENFSKKANRDGVFQIFSSSEIYGDPPDHEIPTRESYRGNVSCLGPRACYDESKRFIETLGSVYSASNGLNVSVVRPFNNYGPGMSLQDGRLPADVMNAIVNKESLSIYSDGTPTRSFCYVADAITGYLLALNAKEFSVYNIGNDSEELSVRDFVEAASTVYRKLNGSEMDYSFTKSKEKDFLTDNPNRRFPDLSKARSELKYVPSVDVIDGLERWARFETASN